MNKLWGVIAAISLAVSVAASPADLAKAARDVGREQGMADADAPQPRSLPEIKPPRNAEGFFPAALPGANPYREQLYDWCKRFSAKQQPVYGISSPQKRILDRLGGSNPDYGTRTEMAVAKNLYYLVTAPDSPYYMNPELFRQYLRRVLCYANEYNVHANTYQDMLNDFFAFGPALYLMRVTDETYGAYLLPSQRKAIADCMTKAAKFWRETTRKERESKRYLSLGNYCNRDLGFANILLNLGLYLKARQLLDEARTLVHAQQKNQYPDGAFAYIGTQNESATYHFADIQMLTRYYVVTGDKIAAELLKKSRICPLLNNEPGGAADFWTAPAWKHTWNGGNYATHESVAFLNAPDPYLRTVLDTELRKNNRQMPDALALPFYRATEPQALPENYTVRDRNLDGIRARYGNWSQAITLRRVKGADEPGLPTLAGAMIVAHQQDGSSRPDAILMFARPKVLFKAPGMKEFAWGFLTDGLRSDSLVGRNYSAFGATARLHADRSSTKGAVAPWTMRQQWLTVKDHMLGLLELAPDGAQEGRQAAVELRLGYGGFRAAHAKELEKLSAREYRYGSLRLNILDTNFPGFEIRKNKIRSGGNAADGTDLIFFTPEDTRVYRPGERYFVLVELYPESSRPMWDKQRLDRGEQSTMEVSADGETYRFTYDFLKNKARMETSDKTPPWKNFEELLRSKE